MQGTIWTVEKRWEQQLEKGSVTVNGKHYIVSKLDPSLAETFSSNPTSFDPGMFENDVNSIFRDASTLQKAIQSVTKETTKENFEMGVLMEALKQTRYLREELFFPAIYAVHAAHKRHLFGVLHRGEDFCQS